MINTLDFFDEKPFWEFKETIKIPKLFEISDELMAVSKQLCKENERLERELLVERTINECMAKLRRQKNV